MKNKGFTIVELIIAMSIFVILFSLAVGGFINSLRNQRIVAALMAVNDNMSLTMEQISREIRTGYNFNKIADSELEFTNVKGEDIFYRLNNGAIEKKGGNLADYTKITADNVWIEKFNIKVCGRNISVSPDNCGAIDNNYPPRITLNIFLTSAEPGVRKLNIFTDIQTTISSRYEL